MFLVFLCISTKKYLFQDQDQPLAQNEEKIAWEEKREAAADGRSHYVPEI